MRHPQPQSQPALPPCPYCGKPCWAPVPQHPVEDMRDGIRKAFKGRTLLSTCKEGQWHDLNATGWCHGAIECIAEAWAAKRAKAAAAQCDIPAGPTDAAVTRVPGGIAVAFRRGEEVWLV